MIKKATLHSNSIYLAAAFLLLILSSCNNKKYLAEGEYIYTGSELRIERNGAKLKNESALRAELSEVIYPEPNLELFGIARPKLWFYNITKEPKKDKGFRYWLKYKVGKAPILLSQTDPDRIKRLLNNRLYNNGYFKSTVSYDVKFGKKEAKVEYILQVDKAYTIDSVFFPEPKTELESFLKKFKAESLLKQGEAYDLEQLKKERQRLSESLRNIGFYYFEPNFLVFEVDSTIGKNKINIFLKVKENIDSKYLETYKIGQINVYPNFDLRDDLKKQRNDTLFVNGCNYLIQDTAFRPEIVTDAIYFKSGENFTNKGHRYTVNRLIGLGAFQFVSVRYYPDSTKPNTLNTYVQLTPYIKKSIRLELSGTTKSNGFTGPGFKTTFRNRNTFRGAELLSINLETGFETQISSNSQGLNSFDLGLNAELDIPRFLLPFGLKSNLSRYSPKTTFKIGFRTLNRLKFYRLNSIELGYGYKWRETKTKYHELYPININYVQLANSEPAFEAILNANPLIRRSFEEQFILGAVYSYTYDSRLKENQKNNFYFKGTADLSGNTAQLISATSKGESFAEETDYNLLGIRFSQYLRGETIFKYYYKINPKNIIANRLIIGAGIPIGNSTTLPYIKQFFVGGGNSIRAFQARTLGPGTYRRTEENTNGNIFIDQSGDLKLEFNTEYRFDVYSIFKGSIFFDMGNIWLINDDPNRVGGQFNASTFTNEFAAGTGLGLRIDPDFFVIRFDVGFPLRKPFLPKGERWVLDEFGKDAVLNIAIGYPF